MEDEEVAESWEEAADSGVRTANFVPTCRCKPGLTAFTASQSLRMDVTYTVLSCRWTTQTLFIFRLLSNLAWNSLLVETKAG